MSFLVVIVLLLPSFAFADVLTDEWEDSSLEELQEALKLIEARVAELGTTINSSTNDNEFVLDIDDNGTITYEQLKQYKELFDPTIKGVDWGKIPVKIEAVIGEVTDGEDGEYSFDMWIKGEECYHYEKKEVDKYLLDLTAFPEKPSYGQRIIYEVTPYSDGGFRGSQVVSFSVIEENVDVEQIISEYVQNCAIPYEEYAELERDFYKSNPVLIETVVGCVKEKSEYDYSFDLWIKGNSGYHYTNQYSSYEFPFPIKPHYGQRIAFRITNQITDYIFAEDVLNVFILDDNVDVKSIEREYLSTLENDVRSHIVEPFDESIFEAISYKKILRSISEYAGKPILIDLTYQQDLNNGYGLFSDKDSNYYYLYICNYSIQDDIIDFNILLKDNVRVYGYIDNELYTYSSWGGDKTVPTIIVRKILLLDDE